MDYCCYMLEQPFVGAVAQEEDLIVSWGVTSKLTPASGNDCPCSCRANGVQNCRCQFLGVVDNNTAKADVYWWRTACQELL
jgi:hypothetical protein